MRIVLVGLIVLPCAVGAGCFVEPRPSAPVANSSVNAKGPKSTAAGPEPMWSDYRGTYECVFSYLKGTHLKDPESLVVVSSSRARIEKIGGKPLWVAEIRYRCRNELGGMVVYDDVAVMSNDKCLMILTQDEWMGLIEESRRQDEIRADAERKLQEIRAEKKAGAKNTDARPAAPPPAADRPVMEESKPSNAP